MKIIEGKKATYKVEEVNNIGDYVIEINGHELYEDGQSWLVSNFDYTSSIDRVENDKKMLLKISIKKLLKKYKMTIKEASDRFEIPYRTIQNWSSGQRECPEYILKMMNEILSKES